MLTLPPAYPDETLPSIFRRICRLNEQYSRDALARILIGVRHCVQREDVGFPLNNLHRAFVEIYGNARSLVIAHGLHHFYRSALRPNQAADYERRIYDSRMRGGVPARLPLAYSPSPFVRWYCEACDRDSMSKWGVIYTHRIHMLPFVTRCVVHKCALELREGSIYEAQFLNFCESSDLPLRFAQIASHAMLSIDGISLRESAAARLQYMQCKDAGRFSATTCYKVLFEQLTDKFDDIRLNRLLADEKYCINCIRRIVRRDTHVHPVILCLVHLVDCEKAQRLHVASHAQNTVSGERDATVTLLFKTGATLAEIAGLLQVSPSTVTCLVERLGLRSPRSADSPTRQQIVLALCAGREQDEIARACGSSSANVSRVLAACPAIKMARAAMRRERKRISVRLELEGAARDAKSAIQLIDRARAAWRWATAWDKLWLRAIMPPPSKRRRQTRVTSASTVSEAMDMARAELIRSKGAPPKRVSIRRVMEWTGLSQYQVMLHGQHLTVTDSQLSFAVRRCVWLESLIPQALDTWATASVAQRVQLTPTSVERALSVVSRKRVT